MRCPVCHHETGFERVDRTDGYEIYRCPRCDVRFAWPFRAPEARYYAPEQDEAWKLDGYRIPLLYLQAGIRLPLSPAHLAFLRRVPVRGLRLLDVGSGSCAFARAVQARGGIAWGLDPSPLGREYCERQGVSRFFAGTLEAFHKAHPELRFHRITMFEVLEHLDRPRETLELIFQMLEPGGIVGISVPDETRASLRWGLRRSPEDYPPHHLTRWTPRALAYAVRLVGFEVVYHGSLRPNPGYSVARRLSRFPTSTEQLVAWLRSGPTPAERSWKLRRVWDGVRLRDAAFQWLLLPLWGLVHLARVRGKSQLLIAQKPEGTP